jgi:N-acetylglutamate synthase-like GNAT family acetyltransferase
MILPEGMHTVPRGHLAAVVTHLQMTAPTMTESIPFPTGTTAVHEKLDNATYLQIFQAIGSPWLWTERALLDDAALAAIISDDRIQTWVIRQDGAAIGLVELDFRVMDACELAYFGMVVAATGQGLGGPMMALAQSRAFSRDIRRFHVHTCTLDDASALPFYQKTGFVPYKFEVEVFPDPRLSGAHSRTAASQIPCLP